MGVTVGDRVFEVSAAQVWKTCHLTSSRRHCSQSSSDRWWHHAFSRLFDSQV